MLCKKELSFSKKCPFEEVYHKNNKILPIDDNSHCLFHSTNLNWKKENNFVEELASYIQFANKDETTKEILFDGCTFVGRSKSKEVRGFLEIQDIVFLKTVNFNDNKFYSETIDFKNNIFTKGIFMHNIEARGLSFKQNTFEGNMQISSSIFQNEFTFIKNTVNASLSSLNNEIIGDADFVENEFNAHVSFRRTYFKVKRYEQEEISPIYNPVLFYNSKINRGFRFHECEMEIGLKVEDCEFYGSCEFTDVDFSFHKPTEFKNVLVEDNLNFTGINERKLFNYNISLDLDIKGKVYFEHANLIFLDENSLAAVLAYERQEKVRIGKGCIKYRYQTKPKTLYLNKDLQNIAIELAQTFTVFFTNHKGTNLGLEILHRDTEKIIFFYFTDQRDISQKQFEQYLEQTEENLWMLIKNPEVGSLALIQEDTAKRNLVQTKQSSNNSNAPRFIDQFIYAKDVLVNTMSNFFKLGARIQQDKCNEQELERILNTIHFGDKKLPIDEKVVYQIILNNYSGTQLINVNKNNVLEIKGNENTIIQGNEKSEINVTSKE